MSRVLDFNAFLATYVNTNVAPGAVPYDRNFFKELQGRLAKVDDPSFPKLDFPVLAAMCCAMKRADLVPPLFLTQLEDQDGGSKEEVLHLFNTFRETINIIWAFVGVPQIVPACLGLAGYLKSRGIASLETNRLRQDFGPEDIALGEQTRRSIYKAAANSEVFEMLDTYYGDFAYVWNGVGFGYNIGRASQLIFSLAQCELIVTATLIALGATRQVGSHIKACISMDFSPDVLQTVIDVAEALARWQGIELPSTKSPIDVKELARQARNNLAKEAGARNGP